MIAEIAGTCSSKGKGKTVPLQA